MSHLWQEKLLKQDINISTSGDNSVITIGQGEMPTSWDNPATYIVIDFISLIPNGTVTIQFNNGSVAEGQTAYGGPLSVVTGQPLTWENAIQNEHGIITLKANHSFVINLNAPVQVSGFIRYRLLASN